MVLRRGSNTGNHRGETGGVPAELDFAALDDLGPRTRQAIVDAPIKVLALPLIEMIIRQNDAIEAENAGLPADAQKPYLNPKDPRLDAYIAKQVIDFGMSLMLKDREFEFAKAGVVPLRPRPSPKSVREQRRAMRGARRWSISGR